MIDGESRSLIDDISFFTSIIFSLEFGMFLANSVMLITHCMGGG